MVWWSHWTGFSSLINFCVKVSCIKRTKIFVLGPNSGLLNNAGSWDGLEIRICCCLTCCWSTHHLGLRAFQTTLVIAILQSNLAVDLKTEPSFLFISESLRICGILKPYDVACWVCNQIFSEVNPSNNLRLPTRSSWHRPKRQRGLVSGHIQAGGRSAESIAFCVNTMHTENRPSKRHHEPQ